MVLDLFHPTHHVIELAFGVMLLAAVWYAVRKFPLARWKRAWHLIAAGAVVLICVEVLEIYATLFLAQPMHENIEAIAALLDLLWMALLVTGIFLLSKSVGKVFGR